MIPPIIYINRLRLGTILSLVTFYLLQATSYGDIDDDLQAYWRFEGSLLDHAAEFHGRDRGGSVLFSPEGKFGQCAYFDGKNSFIEIAGGRHEDFDFEETSFTVSVWFKADTFDEDFAEIITSGGRYSWRIGRWSGRNGISASLGVKGFWDDSIDPREKFHNVVIAYDTPSATGHFFVDGILIESSPIERFVKNLDRVRIGGSYPDDQIESGRWSGWIDDIAIWRRSLSADEVTTIWNDGEGREIQSLMADGDGDGMWDSWERRYGLDDSTPDSDEDPDGDGLTNYQEFVRKSAPNNVDSDGDGVADFVETNTGSWISATDRGTDPLSMDTDLDGTDDGLEIPVPGGSDPNLADTDEDGFLDSEELATGHAPDNPQIYPGIAFGLKSFWSFDEDVTEKTAAGVETVVVGEFPEFPPGMFGNAVRLSGNGQFLEVAAPESTYAFQEARGFTIAGWIAPEKEGVDLIANGLLHRWSFTVDDDKRPVFIPGVPNGGYWTASSIQGVVLDQTVPLPGQFSFFAAVYDNRQQIARVYLDGRKLDVEGWGVGINEDERWDTLVIGANNSTRLKNSWQGLIDDLAIWNRPLTEREIALMWNEGEGRSVGRLIDTVDDDHDGMLDAWEAENGLDLGRDDSAEDPDGDGSANLREFVDDSDPHDADTDDDGLTDGVETGGGTWTSATDTGTSPRKPDSDGDGLLDGAENPDAVHLGAAQSASDPNAIDSDGDEYTDDAEAKFGSLPNDPASLPAPGAGLVASWAFDGDYTDSAGGFAGEPEGDITFEPGRHGLAARLNGRESIQIDDRSIEALDFAGDSFSVSLWIRLAPLTSPASNKGEGLIGKGTQQTWFLQRRDRDITFHPGWGLTTGLSTSFDYPGLDDDRYHHLVAVVDHARKLSQVYLDGAAVDPFLNPTIRQFAATMKPSDSPVVIGRNPDRGSVNGWTGWIDDVAIWNRVLHGSEVMELFANGLSAAEHADPRDEDGDGMNDVWERRMGLDATSNDGAADPDADGLTNAEEFVRRTFPFEPDTDGDGLTDAVESGDGIWRSLAATGTNPLEPDSDGDGLSDSEENPDATFVPGNQSNSNPNLVDTDGDGFDDLQEVGYGVNPGSGGETPGLQHGLTGSWPFDGDFSDVNGVYPGIPEGRTQIAFAPGKFGSALDLDGRDQHVRVGEIDPDDPVGSAFDYTARDMTVSAWFMIPPEASSSVGILVADGWMIFHRRGELGFFSDFEYIPKPAIADGRWHHALAVHEFGREVRIYVDGQQVSARPGVREFRPNSYPLGIGAQDFAPGTDTPRPSTFWRGGIDDVAVWGRTLKEHEIAAIWNDGHGRSIGELTGISAPFEIIGIVTIEPDPEQPDYVTTIRWNSRPNRAYSIDISQDLEHWEEVVDGHESQGVVTEFSYDYEPGLAGAELYFRVREISNEP